jgi:hypothetical protein
MGYAWNGHCYPDANTALDAFILDVHNADGTAITSFTAAPTINFSGVITWSISHRPLTATAATTRTGTTQLILCPYVTFDQWSMQDLFFPVALVFAAFFGFRSGFQP